MNLNFTETKPKERQIKTANAGEAFYYMGQWYTLVQVDTEILDTDFEDFVNHHKLLDQQDFDIDEAIPCLHLASQSLVFIDGSFSTADWAELSATIAI